MDCESSVVKINSEAKTAFPNFTLVFVYFGTACLTEDSFVIAGYHIFFEVELCMRRVAEPIPHYGRVACYPHVNSLNTIEHIDLPLHYSVFFLNYAKQADGKTTVSNGLSCDSAAHYMEVWMLHSGAPSGTRH